MITFAQGGGEMRQGGKGDGSCVIELMKNGVLKAQRFAQSQIEADVRRVDACS